MAFMMMKSGMICITAGNILIAKSPISRGWRPRKASRDSA
jgi:hypothetical protein